MKQPLYKKKTPSGIFCVYTKAPAFPLLELKQTHSACVIDASTIKELNDKNYPIEGDAIIFEHNEVLPIAIKTADCLPIFIHGKKKNIMIHAGWKGLYLNILTNSEIIKAEPLFAFIGPHIKSCCFEVQNDFKNYFQKPDYYRQEKEKFYYDLSMKAISQLKKLSPSIIIKDAGICTCCHSQFHSYRSNKTSERNWNILINENLSETLFT